jgi:hypothetical protein
MYHLNDFNSAFTCEFFYFLITHGHFDTLKNWPLPTTFDAFVSEGDFSLQIIYYQGQKSV